MFILHHYELSPFSEKIRLMLGYTGLSWQSMLSPEMPPRPNLDPLSGGYRRIPVVQKGADVFCDSRLICDELALAVGKPELENRYGSKETQRYVAELESSVFWACVLSIPARVSLTQLVRHLGVWKTLRFLQDRAGVGKQSRLHLPSAKKAADTFQCHLRDMEQRLEQQYLFSDEPTIADFSAYHTLWFKCHVGQLPVPKGLPRVEAWYQRMQAIGHGNRQEITQSQAFSAAATNHPRAIPDDATGGTDIGTEVAVSPTDYALDAVNGTLVGCSETRYIIARDTEQFGTVHVHFPRSGFQCNTV